MDIYDEIENLTKGLPPDQKILEANRLKNIYCNIGYMDTESQRLRKLRSHGITTTLNAELNIAPDSDITLTQQFLDNFPANYNRYMEAYKHSIRLLSDLQQLYAIIVVNMNRGESYLFKGNDQVSNFFSIFKDRLYPQLHPLDRTSNYLFLYCSNDIDIFIAKKALNLCSIHQVTPIDMAQIQRIQNAQKTVEKHDATQIPQTMINRPLDESGKNAGKSSELPHVTTASGSMIKESNMTKESSMISDLNLEPAMKKRRLSDQDLSRRDPSPPRSGPHSRPPSPSSSSRPDILNEAFIFTPTPALPTRRRIRSPSPPIADTSPQRRIRSSSPPPTVPTRPSTDQTKRYSLQSMADSTPRRRIRSSSPPRTVPTRPSTDQTSYYSLQYMLDGLPVADSPPEQRIRSPGPPRTVIRKRLTSDPVPSTSKTEEYNISIKQPSSSTISDPTKILSFSTTPDISSKESDDMFSSPQSFYSPPSPSEILRQMPPHLIPPEITKPIIPKIPKKYEQNREAQERQEKELKEKRLSSRVKRLRRKKKELIEKQIREQQEKQRQLREQQEKKSREKESRKKESKEKELKELRNQLIDKLIAKQLSAEKKLLKQHEKELREKRLKEKRLKEAQRKKIVEDEIRDMFLKEVDKSIDKREEEIREAQERQEKELREKRLKEAQRKKIVEDEIRDMLLKDVDKSIDKREEEIREARERQEKEEKLRRQQEYDSLLKRLRERREELLRTQQELGEKELRAKQLKEAQSKKIVEDEIIDMFLKNVDKSIDKREEEIREARERHEKELREKRLKEKQLKEQQEKELLSQTPTRELEFTSSPSPIKQTDASKVDIKEPEFQTQTPSPATSKKIVEEIQEIQGAKKPLKETEHIISPTSAKERFDRLSAIASLRLEHLAIPYISGTPTKQEKKDANYILSKFDKEKINELARKIFKVSDDERDNLIKLFENFKEKNKTAADQMNFILRNHLAVESELNTFFEFAANYTIHTGIPILDLENKEIYDELKEETDYTQEACDYVAKILSKIKSIINAAKKADIKIRNVPKAQITKVIQETIDKLKGISKTRKEEYWTT